MSGAAAASIGAPAEAFTSSGIAYRRIGSGPPLILVHGSAGSWRHWIRNIDALARIRTVFAPDLPGFGASVSVAPDIPVDAYIDLVSGAIEEMCGGAPAIDLAGFSFGGQIAAGAAARLGRRARRLSLLSPSGFDLPKGRVLALPRRSEFAPSEDGQRAFHRRMLLAVMLADPASADADAIDIQATNVAQTRLDGRHISWSGRMPGLLAEVRCPIQLLYGTRDPMPFPSSQARIALCRAVRPDIRVDLVAGAGHWLQYERPDETDRVLIDFLTTEPGPSPAPRTQEG